MIIEPMIIFENEKELADCANQIGKYFIGWNGKQKVGMFACGTTFMVARTL